MSVSRCLQYDDIIFDMLTDTQKDTIRECNKPQLYEDLLLNSGFLDIHWKKRSSAPNDTEYIYEESLLKSAMPKFTTPDPAHTPIYTPFEINLSKEIVAPFAVGSPAEYIYLKKEIKSYDKLLLHCKEKPDDSPSPEDYLNQLLDCIELFTIRIQKKISDCKFLVDYIKQRHKATIKVSDVFVPQPGIPADDEATKLTTMSTAKMLELDYELSYSNYIEKKDIRDSAQTKFILAKQNYETILTTRVNLSIDLDVAIKNLKEHGLKPEDVDKAILKLQTKGTPAQQQPAAQQQPVQQQTQQPTTWSAIMRATGIGAIFDLLKGLKVTAKFAIEVGKDLYGKMKDKHNEFSKNLYIWIKEEIKRVDIELKQAKDQLEKAEKEFLSPYIPTQQKVSEYQLLVNNKKERIRYFEQYCENEGLFVATDFLKKHKKKITDDYVDFLRETTDRKFVPPGFYFLIGFPSEYSKLGFPPRETSVRIDDKKVIYKSFARIYNEPQACTVDYIIPRFEDYINLVYMSGKRIGPSNWEEALCSNGPWIAPAPEAESAGFMNLFFQKLGERVGKM